MILDTCLNQIKKAVYDPCALKISDFKMEAESKAYHACSFQLGNSLIMSRNGRITPKKSGQFVTFWKRNKNKIIEPLHESDVFDFYIVNVSCKEKLGQFVFPKSVLIKKGIFSTASKEGKRALRVYPKWDVVTSKQATKTQEWQLNYFYEINKLMDLNQVKELYK